MFWPQQYMDRLLNAAAEYSNLGVELAVVIKAGRSFNFYIDS